MDFSKMGTREVTKYAEQVCKSLNKSRTFTEAYFRIHDNNVPVIYATVLVRETLPGLPLTTVVRVTIRCDEIERLVTPWQS